MGDRYVESSLLWKTLKVNSNKLYDWSMSQPLLDKIIHFTKSVDSKEVFETDVSTEIGYFVEVDVSYSE